MSDDKHATLADGDVGYARFDKREVAKNIQSLWRLSNKCREDRRKVIENRVVAYRIGEATRWRSRVRRWLQGDTPPTREWALRGAWEKHAWYRDIQLSGSTGEWHERYPLDTEQVRTFHCVCDLIAASDDTHIMLSARTAFLCGFNNEPRNQLDMLADITSRTSPTSL